VDDDEGHTVLLRLVCDFVEDSLEADGSGVVVGVTALQGGACEIFVPRLLSVFELVSEVKIGEVDDSRDREGGHFVWLLAELGTAEGWRLERVFGGEVVTGMCDVRGGEASDATEVDGRCAVGCEVDLERGFEGVEHGVAFFALQSGAVADFGEDVLDGDLV